MKLVNYSTTFLLYTNNRVGHRHAESIHTFPWKIANDLKLLSPFITVHSHLWSSVPPSKHRATMATAARIFLVISGHSISWRPRTFNYNTSSCMAVMSNRMCQRLFGFSFTVVLPETKLCYWKNTCLFETFYIPDRPPINKFPLKKTLHITSKPPVRHAQRPMLVTASTTPSFNMMKYSFGSHAVSRCATGAPGNPDHIMKCVWHAPDTLGRAHFTLICAAPQGSPK